MFGTANESSKKLNSSYDESLEWNLIEPQTRRTNTIRIMIPSFELYNVRHCTAEYKTLTHFQKQWIYWC